MKKIKHNISNTLTLTALLIVSSLFPLSVSAADTDVVASEAQAATFCSAELPNGSASTRWGYCAFTRKGAASPCVVSSAGSFPSYSDTCSTFSLKEMVGKTKGELKTQVDTGGGVPTTPGEPTDGGSQNNTQADTGSDDLNKLLQAAIDTLAAAAGLIFVVSFIIAGFQYLTARDNASQVAASKERIFTLVITFILFVFGYGLLQWLIPGGIFS